MFRLFKREPVTDNDRKIVERGIRAKDFINTPVYEETMEALEDYFWEQFHSTTPDELDTRELLYQSIASLRAVNAQLQNWVNEGETAQTIINNEEQ